jgi:hypothetical protein
MTTTPTVPGRYRALIALGLLLAGCQDGTPGASVGRVEQAQIYDQVHSGGTIGFFWLPPLWTWS